MQILVTRPRPEGEALAEELTARGYEAVVAPLLTIQPRPATAVDLAGVQALAFTSVNGLRAFIQSNSERGIPCFAVGKATAAAARAAGFQEVREAAGDAESLAARIIASCRPRAGRILHLAGSVTAGDLVGDLRAAGFTASRTALYDAVPAEDLPTEAQDALARRTLDAIVFFSPRTAKTFARLVEKAGLAEACRGVRALCLSRNVARQLAKLPFADVAVALRPEGEALLDLLAESGSEEAPPEGKARPNQVPLDQTQTGGPSPNRPGRPMQEDEPEDTRSRRDEKARDAKQPGAAAEGQETTETQTVGESSPEAASETAGPGGEPPSAAGAVIAAFGGIRPMAHKLGVAVSTVQGWKVRDAIPAPRHDEILAAAQAQGIELDPAVLGSSDTPGAAASGAISAAEAQPEAEQASPAAAEATTIADAEVAEAEEEAAPAGAVSAEDPATPPVEDRKPGFLGGMLLGAALLAIGAGAAIATRPLWAPTPEVSSAGIESDQVQALEARLDDLGADVAALAADAAETVPASELENQVGGLAARIGEVEGEVSERLTALEESLRGLSEGGVQPEALEALSARLDDLETRFTAGPGTEEIVETARAAAGEQVVVALAYGQLRDAVLAGRPYEAELATLRRVAGGDPEIAAQLDLLVGSAAEGVIAMDALRDRFDRAARQAVAASAGDGVEGWLAGVYRRLARLVTIRPTGENAADQSTAGALARAEISLDQNDLAGALEELEGLESEAAEAMSAWRSSAEARQRTLTAMNALAKAVFAELEAQAPEGASSGATPPAEGVGSQAGSTGEDG